MNSLTLLSSIGIGSISASIITLIGTRIFKDIDYKREYYKQIIHKRLLAYNYIEGILCAANEYNLLIQKDSKFNTLRILSKLSPEENHCQKVLDSFAEYATHKNWLSSDLSSQMGKVFTTLIKINETLESSTSYPIIINDNQIIEKAMSTISLARNTYHKDILALHKIRKFLKRKIY